MKFLFTIFFSFLISIYSIGCDSSNSSTNSSNCPINQGIGCDSNCAENPLQNDTCGVCGGNGSTCASSTIDILYNTTTDIGGFQFDMNGVTVIGASGGAAVIRASGGAAQAAGFSVSSSSTTVIGFSFSGSVIPQGIGTLISLEIEGDFNSFCIKDDEGLVLSNIEAESIPVIIENCNTIKYSE